MKFNPRQIVALIKGSPEKVISWVLLIIFISLSSHLAISWLMKTPSFSLEEIAIRQERRKPLTEAAILVDFEGLLTKKPVTYYADIAQRNPFSRLVDPPLVSPEEKRRKKIERIEVLLVKLNIAKGDYEKHLAKEYARSLQGLDVRKMEAELRRLIGLDENPDEPKNFLDYLKVLGEEKIKVTVEAIRPGIGLTCCGIIGTPEGRVAFIEGQRTYWVKRGDAVEGWKVLRVEQKKVTLYKEEEKKGLILYLGGRCEELEDFDPEGRDAQE